jgi:hypothetical protein
MKAPAIALVLLAIACGVGEPAPVTPAPTPVARATPTPDPDPDPDPAPHPDPDPDPAPAPDRTADLQAGIDALPVIARIDDLAPTRFVLRGNLTDERGAEMERIARAVVADVARRFVGDEPRDELAPVDVCLFESEADYVRFSEVSGYGDSLMGYYLGRERLVVANLARSVGNLRHELVHPLVGDDFDDLPSWVNEGLGSLYGTARLTDAGVVFLVNYRLRDVRKALARGDLPTLDDIALSGRGELYGGDGMTYYGTARYLLLYLDAAGTLDDFYRDLRADPPTVARQLELLERYIDYDAFLRWTKRLRKHRVAAKP